jgi:hypothetical protein
MLLVATFERKPQYSQGLLTNKYLVVLAEKDS